MLAATSFVLALVGCSFLRSYAQKRALLDHPNERSLHKVPIPRLGGVAIVVASAVCCALFGARHGAAREMLVWAVLSLPVAVLGLIDDLRPLPASLRFLLQFVFAGIFLYLCPLPREIVVAGTFAVAVPAAVSATVGVIFIVGLLNIYNFMDGMDGLAGSQAIGAGLALAAAGALHGHGDIAAVGAFVAAASAGFLLHNFPPAKIFMGDAGSTYLGFTFAAMAILGVRRVDPLPLAVLPVALAPFLLDGTFTIARRASRREPIWRAHRSHLYQRAVGAGLTHHEVLVPYAVWTAFAAAAAVATSRSTLAAACAALAMLAALTLTWRWVLRLEASGTDQRSG